MSMMAYYPIGPLVKGDLFYIHSGFLLSIVMMGIYLKLDWFVGMICLMIYVPGYMLGNALLYDLGDDHLKIIGTVHAVSWIMQFLGHGIFENRRPALVDNILLTLAAPMFVVMEGMLLLGYSPNYLKEIHEAEGKRKVK